MTSEATVAEGRIQGEWQKPVNLWQGAPNSIHNDTVAKSVGMRGGTIPGTVHLSHFRPILTDLFGDAWLKSGSISMYYTFATTGGEPVRAFVKAPPPGARDIQLEAWVENEEGRVVCKGTVAVGKPDVPPYVRSLPLENAAPDQLRILAAMEPGMETAARDDYMVKRGGESGEVRDPQAMYGALAVFPEGVDTKPAVGFFGASEIILHAGPIRTETPYRKSGRVVAVCASPKTEFAWFDSWLHDQDGALVAEMRHMTRWMKVSSPLWKS
jgi:hypothetical protein